MSTEMKKEKRNTQNNLIFIVQICVAVIMTVLLFLTQRLNPEFFMYFKNSYNNMITDNLHNTVNTSSQNVEDNIIFIEKKDKKGDDESVAVSLTVNDEITVPAHGEITSRFGGRTNPISGLYAVHTGVDIAAPDRSKIVAAYNGIAEETGNTEKAGNYVLLLHSDGSQTLYCHCSEICVEENQLVKAGDVIAKVGSTGWATGPHLHFEIRIDGESVDPMDYLTEKDGCV